MVARTVTATCAGISSSSQGELEDLALPPEHDAKVDAGAHFPDLVADVAGRLRRLGVVEDDALLAVDPARFLVDLGPDALHVERRDLVLQVLGGGAEDLPLPGDEVRGLGVQ